MSIQLTAAQAAAINTGIQAVAASTPELAWLADSASLVLKTGTIVDSARIDVNLGGEPYYAVSLQRMLSHPTSPFSTFETIYFNNPTAPTRFVIVSAFARGTVGPPDGVIVNIATPTPALTATVRFYVIEGSAVTHWRATSGNIVMGNGLPGAGCTGIDTPNNVDCETAELLLGVTVSATTRESGSAAGSPTLSIVDGLVRGIKLKFQTL